LISGFGFSSTLSGSTGLEQQKAAKTGLFRKIRYAVLDIARREKRKQK